MPENSFRFVDGIAPADAAFEAFGDDLPTLFAAAAEALFSTIIELELIEPRITRHVSLSSDTEESLLFAWLAELIYLKDVHRELYSRFNVSISSGETLALEAEIAGASAEDLRHRAHTDVKAVTYHKLKVEHADTQLKAFVILDL
jgi:SHS2 domain-containing protein